MAKRVNTKFLIILVAVLGLGASGVAAKFLFFSKKNPAPYIKRGDAAIAAGNLNEASTQYHTALLIDGTNKDVLVKWGDTLYKLAGEDLENFGKARNAWAVALQIDPGYVQALDRLLDTYWEELEIRQGVELFRNVKDYAGRLANTESAPPELRNKANARLNIAVIRQAEKGITTSPADIDKAVAALTDLAKKEPANSDIPWYIARAKVSRIVELRRSPVGREESDKMVAEIGQMLDDALKGQEANASMQLRAYQGFATLAQLAPRPANGAADRPDYAAKAEAALKAARANVQPNDRGYVEVQLTAAEAARRKNESDETAAIFSELVKNRPDDQKIRLTYARIYDRDPSKREALIELLAKPIGNGKAAVGVDAFEYKLLEAETTAERTNLQINAYLATQDKAQRQALLKEVKANIEKLETNGLFRAEHPTILRLRGNMHILEGNLVNAVEAMDKALRLTQKSDADYYDLEYQLAGLYAQTGQTGQARKLLVEVIEKYGTYIPARVMLAQVYLKENNNEAAQQQLQALQKIAKPDNVEVQRLAVVIAERTNPGDTQKLISNLPEGTRDEKVRKAQFIASLGEREPATKLLDDVFNKDPKDVAAANLLIQLYATAEERDKALDVAKRALAATPDSKPLQKTVELLQKKLPQGVKETYAFQKQLIEEQTPDAVAREVKLYDLDTQYNNVEEAEKHLAAAVKQGADQQEVLIRQFGSFIRQGKFNEAETVVGKLSELNADDVGGYMYRFRLETERGRLPEALATAQEMVKRRPNFAQGYVSLGQAQQATSNYREAIQSYNQAIDKQPRNREAMRGLIDCYTFLNERVDQRRTIDVARKLFPTDPLFRELEIAYELAYGDPETVIAGREKLYQSNSKAPANALALASALVRTANQKYSGKANEAKARELRSRARDVLAATVKQSPDDVSLVASLAEVLQSLGDNAGAKAALDEFAAQPGQKEKSATNLLLSDYYKRANQWDEAEAQLREALQKSSGADVRQLLLRFLVGRQKFTEALALLGPTPDEPRSIAQRIEILIASKNFEQAEKEINQQLAKANTPALKSTGDYLRLVNLLSSYYLESGQPNKAMENASKTLAQFKQDDAALYYRGVARMSMNPPDFNGAVEDLAVVSDRSPKNMKVLLALAEANFKAGDTDAAILGQSKALELEPLNKEVRARLIDWHASLGHSSDVLRLVDAAKARPELADEWAWDRSAAMVYSYRGEFPKALASIDAAMKLARDNDKAGLANDQLTIMYKAKDYAGMLRVTEQLLAQGRNDWWIFLSRGMARMGTKDTAAVSGELDKAFAAVDPKVNPGEAETLARTVANAIAPAEAARRIQPWQDLNWTWRLLAAEFNQAAGDFDRAADLIGGVIGEVEKSGKADQIANAYRRAAAIYLSMQPPQIEKAVDIYKKVLALSPNDLYALNNLAYLLAEEVSPPRPQEAKQFSQRAYNIVRRQGTNSVGHENLLIIDTHGWVLVLCGGGDLDQGIRVLNEALSSEGFAEAYYHLGEALLRKGKPAEARDQLQAADGLIQKNKEAGKPVDDKLAARIKAAMDKASQAAPQAQAR